MHCPSCGSPVRLHERNCIVCDADVGYPNVRAVKTSEEMKALEQRMEAATDSCTERKCPESLERFQAAVQKSRAVLCRPIGQVLMLISSDNEVYASFYDQLRARTRRAEDSIVDQERQIADALLFPSYQHEIRFAALSMNGVGVRSYGGCSLVLADAAIRNRATVFEKNSLEFCRERKLGAGNPLPPGYRALWKDRAILAAAKLHASLNADTDPSHFPNVPLNERTLDFVEVHIYGPIQRRAAEEISSEPP